MLEKKHLIVIGGATATGKTAAAIRLAKHFGTEILSADSRQFYREMSIGTAKPSAEELVGVRHHFIDSLSVEEAFSVGDFEREALRVLEIIFSAKNVAVMAGGSGLFIRAVCEGLDEFPEVPLSIQDDLKKIHAENGLVPLQSELQQLDPDYARTVDLQNPVRILRALGVCRASGRPFSSFRKGGNAERDFSPIYLRLDVEREKLYARINERVDKMMAMGQLEEAQNLFPKKHLNALQTVGYQELFDFFENKTTLEDAVELIKRNTRRYAKRQMTWFRRDDHWRGFDPKDLEGMIGYVEGEMGIYPKGS